jgi:hypothetical protein
MKKIVIALIFFIFHFSLFTSAMAQGVPAPQRHTLSFESRNYETFTVFVDGTVQNRMPQSRVMVNDVSSQTHEVVVVMKSPEQKAAVLQLLPGEPVVTVYVDYDSRLERMMLYTPSYNLAEKETSWGVKGSEKGVKGSEQLTVNNEQLTVNDESEGPKVVTEEDLVGMLLRMKGQPFDSDRLALGKVIVSSSTLTAEQIGRLTSTIDYSASQVEFLKYAFSYCADPQNYYKAIDVLTFNSDKRKVMDYIATQ